MALSQRTVSLKPDSISIDDLKSKLEKQTPHIDWGQILKAYEYSKKAHEGQKRKSGEPYITHPLNVAYILADLNMDQESLITALLHDVVEDTPVSLQDIKKEFGSVIAFLLDGVTKISRIQFKNNHQKQSENIRKMIVAMGRDVRVILIKLADRLHNLRTLKYMPKDKQMDIANETLEVYTPLASRLGMHGIKTEMEDLSFKYSQPENFANLERKMQEIHKDKNIYKNKVIKFLKEELLSKGIFNCEVTGRFKNLYSIHRKMIYQHLAFEEIFDIVAFRICVEEVHECYEALGLVHALWKPVPGRFKDFIAMPKSNNYQSLHTTVLGLEGRQIEIQIRTHTMHLLAEKGVAAHWIYKIDSKKPRDQDKILKFNWLQDLVSLHQNSDDSGEFLENVKRELFESEIYVLTPEGDIKEFPVGATPIDFAYAIHTQLGEKTIGAKVNGRQVTLDYKLKSGDKVEIIADKKPKPSKDWLKICVTSKARSKIRNFFNTEERKKSMEIGEKLFEKGCHHFKVSEKDILSHLAFPEFMKSRGLNKQEELFVELGFGKLVFKQIIDFLRKTEKKDSHKFSDKINITSIDKKEKESKGSPLVIEGADNVMVHFAHCCYPVAGDHIKAYVSKKRGIVVHRNVCKTLAQISPERFIEVNWKNDQSTNNDYTLSLYTMCMDKPGTLSEISKIFNFFDLNITNLKVNRSNSLKVFLVFDTKVKGLRQANQLMDHLSRIDNVLSVKRKTDFE